MNVALNKLNDKITCFNAAVMHDNFDGECATLRRSRDPAVNYRTSVLKKTGDPITVPAVHFGTLLRDHTPSLVKMDNEGAEIEILQQSIQWESVQKLVFEYTVNPSTNSDAKGVGRKIEGLLRSAGFKQKHSTFSPGPIDRLWWCWK